VRRCHSLAGFLLALALLGSALSAPGADCTNNDGHFIFIIMGPESHDNLWQFASIRGWKSTSSATTYNGGHNHSRLVYAGTTYAVEDTPCAYGLGSPDGSTLVIVAEYTSGSNTTTQRAYYAAASLVTANPAPAIPDATMREVPVVGATQDTGTVTVTWTEPTTQAEVVGYRILRSTDGLAPWTTVADKAVGDTSTTDAPGSGTFYYALEIIYQNDGTNKVVSPHGLSASVTIP
jgi:hypothetical protein